MTAAACSAALGLPGTAAKPAASMLASLGCIVEAGGKSVFILSSMERAQRGNTTSQANLFTLRSVHTSGGRRWWGPEGGGTRHNVERRNPTDTRTAYILQGFPSEHSKCPSGTPYVQQACGSTGEAVKQTSGTCRNAKHPEPKTRKAVKAS
jgi:hypothetical protein